MICSKCKISGELKTFQTFQYFYCKQCKEEIELEEAPKFYANSKEFQGWLNLKIEAGKGNVEIQQGNEPARKLNLEEV